MTKSPAVSDQISAGSRRLLTDTRPNDVLVEKKIRQ
jgi:hypothetical protein